MNISATPLGRPLALALLLMLPALAAHADTVRESRDVAGFKEVVFKGSGDLIITQGDSEGLVIEAEQKVLDVITTEVRGEVLQIGRRRGSSVRSREDIVFELSVRELTRLGMSGSGDAVASELTGDAMRISISGSSDVRIDTLDVDELTITISGSGNLAVEDLNAAVLTASISGSGEIAAAGEVGTQDIAVSGSGDFLGIELQSDDADVTVVGSGDVEVWASRKLTVTVTGSGDVSYRGAPEVSARVTGSGTVEAREGELY